MKICLGLNSNLDQTLPLMPVKIYAGSALPIELFGIPRQMAGDKVISVTVVVTNADGMRLEAPCELTEGQWSTILAASSFLHFGFVGMGFNVKVFVQRGTAVLPIILAVADFEIKKSDPNSQPGIPSGKYVAIGDDIYFKTNIIENVQHYVKQEMVYRSDNGWGAEWTGDYILDEEGNFIPANMEVSND